MSNLKPNAQEDKDVESVSDSPGRTLEPLQSHTFSLKNNAAGLSSDEHENPLNGTQPNPFVYSSVPAVPHAGNSLPSGALVNGPGSHPTSEVHCVLNKGSVLSNNVLDAEWQAEKDTSPEVLPPPSELQSDAWKNTAGPVVKTLATQPGVNTPLSHSEENESKLAYSTLSGDRAEQMHISQPLTKQTMKTRSRRDVERSQSSLDDYDDAEVIRWDSARERFLHDDRRLETKVMHQRDMKHNTHVRSMSGSLEKVNNSLNDTYRRFCFHSGNDVENVDIANKDDSLDAENNDCEAFGSPKQANCPATVDFLLSARNLKLDQMFYQGSKNDRASGSLQAQAREKSPSMRAMSTPLHNTIDNLNVNVSPRLSQRLNKQSADQELKKGCEGSSNFSDDTSGATGSFLESSENERNPYARRHFRKRQRFSAEDQSPHVLKDEDDGDEDCSDIEQLVIKEEYIETTVCDDSPGSPCTSTSDSFDVFPSPGVEHKPCPYCPAMFESGVGLSNHVRGHLHRVGLSYNARHMVSPEQVALRDYHPRIRRRIPCGTRKIRKAVKPETQEEHTCPLCCGWFDTKTGLSNHVRGHLKRIGRSFTSTSKSPLYILNELLQDKTEHRNILQVLSKSQYPSRSFVPPKFISSKDLVLMSTGIPVKIKHEMRSPHPMSDSFVPKQEAEAFSERKKLPVEAKRGSKASSSTLVELLKMRQESLELTARNNQEVYANRKLCDLTKEYMEETQVTSVEPTWAHEECDPKKICIQCNGTFPRLPGHFQAYAHRKRLGIFEEPGYDYKQKKPRPRPGLKKKILPSLNAEIYTLTCRFCDLVFQGPLSVQEDWIKHLQRHLLHTRVPHSGTGMVEVLGLHHKIQIGMSGEHPDPVA
ncbi:uncharacterized protein znf644b [Pagrus major]|uniref:uncharacterized protein znf644b n=1 Tax=Pagrus major TaxID=143350 RepID=UPI003CC8A1E7